VLAGYAGWVAGQGPHVNAEPGTRDFVWAANLPEARMFGLLIGLVVIALVAGALGFTGVAAGAATAARIVFGIMVIGIIVVVILMAMGIAILT
jgi:uncharacterized membrane protein YtjA (UPF0391 family)